VNIQKLLETLRYDTDTLYWELIQELETLGMKPEYEFDDWIYVNNSNPIMLVAHMDTISRAKKLRFRVKHNKIMARNSVLGADDRAGIYAIMEILNRCKQTGIPMPSVLFTNYEESGLIGVDTFIKARKMEKNVKLFIELDRRGSNEYVVYDYSMPKEVQEYIERYGYVKDIGSVSDVANLTEEYNIPHVNLSVGYYNQHTSKEYLVPSELEWSIGQVFEMVQNPIEELYEVESYKYGNWYGQGGYYGMNHYDDYDWYGRNATNNRNYNDAVITYPEEEGFTPIELKYLPENDFMFEVVYTEDYEDIAWDWTNYDSHDRNKGVMEYTDDEWKEYYNMY